MVATSSKISAAPAKARPVSSISLVFRSQKAPTGVKGLEGHANKGTASRYEATVTLSGGLSGTFRGTIFPDNMDVKGHVVDGSYSLYLGFHKVGSPRQQDLVVRTNGFRAVLVICRGNALPVKSNNPEKTSADGIHVHNGYYSWKDGVPMSEGCLLIHPADWKGFLTKFLKAFPDLADWSTNGSRVGRLIGTVTVQAPKATGG